MKIQERIWNFNMELQLGEKMIKRMYFLHINRGKTIMYNVGNSIYAVKLKMFYIRWEELCDKLKACHGIRGTSD